MVVAARLAWLRDRITAGTSVRICVGTAHDCTKAKVKFSLNGRGPPTSMITRQVLLGVVDSVSSTALLHVSVDRGHRFSSGDSEVAIWITYLDGIPEQVRSTVTDGAVAGGANATFAATYPITVADGAVADATLATGGTDIVIGAVADGANATFTATYPAFGGIDESEPNRPQRVGDPCRATSPTATTGDKKIEIFADAN